MRLGALWSHVSQIDNGSVVLDESCRQRDKGVFHPETLNVFAFKHEKHALMGRHLLAKHQTDLTLLGCDGELGVDQMHASLQFDTSQVELGVILGQVVSPSEQNQNEGAEFFHVDHFGVTWS